MTLSFWMMLSSCRVKGSKHPVCHIGPSISVWWNCRLLNCRAISMTFVYSSNDSSARLRPISPIPGLAATDMFRIRQVAYFSPPFPNIRSSGSSSSSSITLPHFTSSFASVRGHLHQLLRQDPSLPFVSSPTDLGGWETSQRKLCLSMTRLSCIQTHLRSCCVSAARGAVEVALEEFQYVF